jgi:PAS domain S-box-containing protein
MATRNEFALQPDGAELLFALQELSLQLTQTPSRRMIAQQVVEWLARLGLGAAIVSVPPSGMIPALEDYAAPNRLAAEALRLALALPGEPRLVEQVLRSDEVVRYDLDQVSAPFVELEPLAGFYLSVLGYPLSVDQQPLGALLIGVALPEVLTLTLQRTLVLLARQVSLALHQAEAQAHLGERLAQHEQRYQRLRRAYDLVTAERRILVAALEAASDGVLITETDGQVRFGNPAIERTLGIHPDMLIGHLIHETDVPTQFSAMLHQARLFEEAQEGELTVQEGRTLHISIAPVKPLDGPIQGYVALMRDITHFKQLDEMKSRFVATVSHDLKSPLSIMNGYLELLETERPLDENQIHYVNRIKATLQRLVSLVSDLLDLGRLDAHIGLDIGPCDLSLIVRSQIETYRLKASEKAIHLIEASQINPPQVLGDPQRLQQVLGNLIGNAITYTPSGGRVTIAMGVRESQMVVSVSDTGVGIDPHELPQIFEPFFRATTGRRMNNEGTGLGLAIVKRIIEEHGGQITVESLLDTGSTFRFTIPLADR